MCGIFVAHGMTKPFSHRLMRSMRKRGPDSIGFWSNGVVRMAHTRLAIIGLDERGEEPMESDTHVLVYNGENYNFHDINQKLAAQGVHLRGANDAEVLLHAWRLWGESILREMDGFWAFSIYDKIQNKLYLVRDQLGVKPLYYWRSKNGFGAASLIRTLLEFMDEPPELDYQALSEYVRYQFTFGDKTFIKQIHKVLPGHIIELDLNSGEMTDRCYEDILNVNTGEKQELTPQWMEETRELIKECAIASTISDTSFTTFCSGGLDSSLITLLTSTEIAYHANFTDPECNETYYARRVVENTSTRLFVVNAEEDFNLIEKLDDILEDFDEPTIGSVILPLDDLLAQVKRRYKVILTGTGGDELFAGYARYQIVLGECYQDSYKALFNKVRHLPTAGERFEATHTKGDVHLYPFYDPTVQNTFKDAYEQCCIDNNDLDAMLRFDRRYFLPGLLNIDDKMCGRHSLESRPSLLHQKLVRHMQNLDANAFLRSGELKPLLRDLAEGILPKAVIQRTDKMGFTTPIGTFVNQNAHLIREQITNSPFRHLYHIEKMNLTAETKFSREVFGLLMLDLWLNKYAKQP